MMGMDNGEDVARGPNAGVERIFVSVRLRPLNEKERAINEVIDWECVDDNTIVYNNHLALERSMFPTSYTFDRVFGCGCSTRQVYKGGAKTVALSVVSGVNSSVFAYGQTSSGKTYTMTGITAYAMADIFDYIQKHKEREFVLTFSAMEIYNESVRDLLSSDGTPLRLLDDRERGTVVEKLTEETLRDWDHLKELLSICQAQRQIGETCMNEASSRSHQIIRLTIESYACKDLGNDSSSSLSATVDFVDLAGSERASQSSSGGSRLKEGCHINRSLLTLGSVIRKLSKGRYGHIPYRDSKLTRILQSSLGGNARTAIICTMSPARGYVEQSRNTLLFASCAKDVSTNVHANVRMSNKALVQHLQRELSRLKRELRSALPSQKEDAGALLMEKNLQIEKLERVVRELTMQRDLALAQLQDLLQGMGNDKSTIIWGALDPCYSKIGVGESWESLFSDASTLVDDQSTGLGFGRYETSDFSVGLSEITSDDNFLLRDFEENLLPTSSSRKILIQSLSDISSQILNESPNSFGNDGLIFNEVIEQQNTGHSEDSCREVGCIEFESSPVRDNVDSTVLSREENGKFMLLMDDENLDIVHQEKGLKPPRQDAEASDPSPTYAIHSTKEQPVAFDMDDGCECENVDGIAGNCEESTIHNRTRSWPEKLERYGTEVGNLYSKGNEFFGKLQHLHRKLSSLRSEADCEIPIAKLFPDGPQVPDMALSHDHGADDSRSITITKEPTDAESKKELAGTQVDNKHLEEKEPIQNANSVGVDLQHDSGVTHWISDFKKLQREIIELWHFCNVPLIYRTYFFLVFKDDPLDAVYMEVERRRVTSIKDAFSWGEEVVIDGHTITPGSSLRSLRQEREMLTKLMKKRLSKQERKELYKKWGIEMGTRKRSLKLANLLWANVEDINHIKDSAEVVARLIKFNFQQICKGMFGINLIPKKYKRKFHSWKLGTRLL